MIQQNIEKSKHVSLNSANEVISILKKISNKKKAQTLSKFYKTGPGEYAENEVFWGITVPQLRVLLPRCRTLPLQDIEKLLDHPAHECRLLGSLILVEQYRLGNDSMKKNIFDFYLSHTYGINNWDIVDLTAPKIVGDYLLHRKQERKILFELAKSNNLWKRRIAIVSTLPFIKKSEFTETFEIAKILIRDPHNLIQKAIGWMLREVGKIDFDAEKAFLDKHSASLPRIALRYALEHFPKKMKHHYLHRTTKQTKSKSKKIFN